MALLSIDRCPFGSGILFNADLNDFTSVTSGEVFYFTFSSSDAFLTFSPIPTIEEKVTLLLFIFILY